MCHSTELVHQSLSGLFLKFWLLLGLFDQVLQLIWSSGCNCLLATLLIQSSYSLNYNLPIVPWTEVKHYLSTYAAQRWLDVFGVMAQNGPCLKCLNCDDLFECTKCLFCVCLFSFVLFVFVTEGFFFCSHWHYYVLYCKHCHLILSLLH